MVYISFPTEPGTLYSKKELEDISAVCHEFDIPLYLDGARLGYGLMSDSSDLTIEDIARLTDVFYIGGTKVGALCGEAVVFTKNNKPAHFMTSVKKRGALLAKGRLLGIQFDTLFTDGLYWKISRHAIEMAGKLKEIIRSKGWEFYMDSPTNQQLILMDEGQMSELGKTVLFDRWGVYDENRTIVRLATSWSTTEEDLKILETI
jgi:threonine aldolase